jgi:tetratricopeptide (TPR) repeat protein
MSSDHLITLNGFLDEFGRRHWKRQDRPFCFILGAGASRQSGIPAGAEMAREWLEMLHKNEDFEHLPLDKWATQERLGIPGFDLGRLADFYPQLYARRFRDCEEDGYAFLEDKMQGKEPSFGYSVLAYMLAETQHKILVTTNFDNLAADALSIHSRTFPIVVGHDSLADYVRATLRRPLIAKVHGSLGFAPKSSPEDLSRLTEHWQTALQRIIERYTPIVIGYDGNDGSLMSLLEKMPKGTPDTAYWCVHCPEASPQAVFSKVPSRVREYVAARKGRLVPIPGFDELMLLIHRQLSKSGSVPDLYDSLKKRSEARVKLFDEQHRELTEKLDAPVMPSAANASETAKTTTATVPPKVPPEVAQLLLEAAGNLLEQRQVKPWWVWESAAKAARDLDARERTYKEGLKALPKSPELLGNFANFLWEERKDADRAEEYYRRALEADPKHAGGLINLAQLLLAKGEIREGR